MKKILTLAVVALFAVSASAQYFVGGNVGFGMDKTKPDEGVSTKNTSFNIMPVFGYDLNNNESIGIELEFLSTTQKDGNETKINVFAVSPFFRYYFFDFGKFRVAAQANVDFNTGKMTRTVNNVDMDVKTTGFGINVAPLLTYELTKKVTLVSSLNFMNLGFNQQKVKDRETTTNFGIGVNTTNVANTGDLSIGFVYCF